MPAKTFKWIAALLAATPALAQEWPARPVTMVVPFAAGGEADVLGRIVARGLADLLAKPVVVENVGGAGGTTGAARVAKAPPDGYTILFAGRGQFVLQSLSKAPLYGPADFAPVVLIAETPIVLIARSDLPAGNIPDFIAYAKANQEKMQYGSPGAGSTPHLSCVLFNTAIGVAVTHVPYRSGGAAMQDLLAGRIDYQCTGVSTALPQIEAGKVKAIAVLTRDRSPLVPQFASAHEQGAAEFDASVWYGLMLPKGAPAAIVRKLHEATLTAMTMPSIEKILKDNGGTMVAPTRRSGEYFQEFVVREIDKWGAAVKAAGVAVE
jgi:tripartite-type tricarboxylate transporter receptor subunit TctC